jgi:flagellar biosynthesis protein FliR
MSVETLISLTTADGGNFLWLFVFALARMGAIVWVAPLFGGPAISRTARLGVGLALALLFLPQILPSAVGILEGPPLFLATILVKEVAVGAAIGFVSGMVFWAAQSAGWLIDTVRGANMAEAIIPQTRKRSTPMGSLFFQLTIVLFFSLGGHRLLVVALAESYVILPVESLPKTVGLQQFAILCVKLSGELILIAVSIAAPVIASTLIADISVGWINRFVPQLNVFFLVMPLKAALGIAVVAVTLGSLLAFLPKTLELGVGQLTWALRLLGGG